ncbi:MAG TPA: hypothetical protein VFA85_07210 [Terriglobales bacterium]|nr:hypothetical protein [Terriglobales bacterium]
MKGESSRVGGDGGWVNGSGKPGGTPTAHDSYEVELGRVDWVAPGVSPPTSPRGPAPGSALLISSPLYTVGSQLLWFIAPGTRGCL